MAQRLVADLAPFDEENTRQLRGLPPELTGGVDARVPMPPARLLVITTKPDGVFLERFAFDGEFAGDTWHRSVEEAKQQADSEFGPRLGEWRSVPQDVEDPVRFGLGQG